MVHVKNASSSDVAGSPLAGAASPGTSYTLVAGTYTVSEDASSTFTESIGGNCDSSGVIALLAGASSTCTITNTNNTVPPSPLPATLHVAKLVVGTAAASDFTLTVKNATSGTIIGSAPGVATPGTAYSLSAGNYIVSENASSSYTEIIAGDCASSGTITLAAGEDETCLITNTNIPIIPAVVVPQASVFSGGGISNGGAIVPLIGILKVPTPLALPAGPGSVTYNYTVWNVGGQQALDNVSVADNTCSPVTYVSGDTNSNGKLDPGEHWKYACTVTLSTTTTNTAVATGYSDDSYHQAAFATAVATVVLGSSSPAPLVNIVKVPSRLTPLPFGGGDVTYTYTVTNPGVVAMHDVVVTDNKCAPVSYVSGDANSDHQLEPGETWTYTCGTNISVSTMNTATAKGSANGFTATGYAFATVLVASPGLPNTGFPPERDGILWDIVALISVCILISISLAAALRKRRL
jgi:uncharacterized repeat protein (TIGR01451 family)